MSNPFDRHRQESANDSVSRPVIRTNRPYVMDLADAYNRAMSPEARARGLEWYVTSAGELKLGDNAAWSRTHTKDAESRRETERARFVRKQLADYPA